MDAVAELVRVGLIDRSGRFVDDDVARALVPGLASRLARVGQERVFVLHDRGEVAESVYLSQRDVRELQFAKASIATGWRLLAEELGVAVADIQQVLVAGDRLPGALVRAHRPRRARPLAGAARRLLRPLLAGGLARAAPDARAP